MYFFGYFPAKDKICVFRSNFTLNTTLSKRAGTVQLLFHAFIGHSEFWYTI
jgi:hypothetical protein